MAYDRYDRGDNDGRSRDEGNYRGRQEGPEQRFGNDRSDQGGEDRGFFERARDEVTSWFGDEEAERHLGEGFDTVYPGDPSGMHRDGSAYGDVRRSNAINMAAPADDDVTTLDRVTVTGVADPYSSTSCM